MRNIAIISGKLMAVKPCMSSVTTGASFKACICSTASVPLVAISVMF